MRTIFVTFLLFTLQLTYGQDSTLLFKPQTSTDTLAKGIIYEADPRAEALLKELRSYEIQGDMVVIDGYRIQIFFSNDRKSSDDQRQKFIRMHPDQDSQIEYDAPNYTVKVGAFRTRDEAEDFRNQITREFPMSIIQRHKIRIPIERERTVVEDTPEE